MKILTTFITLATLAMPTSADEAIRPDIAQDIPLAEAIRRANEQFPSAEPLTEEEVVAAVQAIKLKHPDIGDEMYETYMRVVKERVLPKDMYFARITSWNTPYGRFEVDWKDLRHRGRPARPEEREEFLSKLSDSIVISGKETRVEGFGYRIRARFIGHILQAHETNQQKVESPESNKIGRANRRPASPLETRRQFESTWCAPPCLSAAVAHLCRWPCKRELVAA